MEDIFRNNTFEERSKKKILASAKGALEAIKALKVNLEYAIDEITLPTVKKYFTKNDDIFIAKTEEIFEEFLGSYSYFCHCKAEYEMYYKELEYTAEEVEELKKCTNRLSNC